MKPATTRETTGCTQYPQPCSTNNPIVNYFWVKKIIAFVEDWIHIYAAMPLGSVLPLELGLVTYSYLFVYMSS